MGLIHMLEGTRAAGSTLARLWLTLLDIEGCQPVNPVWRVLSTLLDIQSPSLSMWAPASSITLMVSSVIHPVFLVGYSKSGSQHYWIVKNSWGTGWGTSGYIHMKMGENSCGIANMAMYPLC